MTKGRLEAIVDAVLAIIMTILVLEIHLPENNHSVEALIEIAPKFLAYVVSFVFIAVAWINHHFIFTKVEKINSATLGFNFFFLFCASLLPATTAWLGSDMHATVPAVLYATNITLFNVSVGLVRQNITSLNNFIDPRSKLELISFIINVISLVMTFIWPPAVYVGLLMNLVLWAVVNANMNNK